MYICTVAVFVVVDNLSLDVSLEVWKLLTQDEGTIDGSYKVMVSLDTVLTTGQGLLIFSMFIADYELMIAPVEVLINQAIEKIKQFHLFVLNT